MSQVRNGSNWCEATGAHGQSWKQWSSEAVWEEQMKDLDRQSNFSWQGDWGTTSSWGCPQSTNDSQWGCWCNDADGVRGTGVPVFAHTKQQDSKTKVDPRWSPLAGHTIQVPQSFRGGGGDCAEDVGHSCISERKGRTFQSGDQYEFTLADVRGDAFFVKPRSLAIHWSADDAVPEEIRQSVSDTHHAVATNGNGACAIHSVFGRPSTARELFCPGARELATHFLRMLPEAARSDEAAAHALNSIYTSFWNEFTKPVLNNVPSDEGRLFWDALARVAPEVAMEARRCVELGRDADRRAESAREQVLIASRRFFTAANEHAFIRSVAVEMGYISATTQVTVENNGQLLVRDNAGSVAVVEGLQSASTEDGYVKGAKRVLFPHDGPNCKYSALFDPRPMFDFLRAAFLVYGDPDLRATSFLRLMEARAVHSGNVSFLADVQAWMATTVPVEAPANFGARAWDAYLACVQDGRYYFSVEELIGICAQASVRVLVFKDIAGVLTFAGGSLRGQGPLMLTKLNANNERRVHSHFERIVSATLMKGFRDSLQEEKQQRLREEARLREAVMARLKAAAVQAAEAAARLALQAAQRQAEEEAVRLAKKAAQRLAGEEVARLAALRAASVSSSCCSPCDTSFDFGLWLQGIQTQPGSQNPIFSSHKSAATDVPSYRKRPNEELSGEDKRDTPNGDTPSAEEMEAIEAQNAERARRQEALWRSIFDVRVRAEQKRQPEEALRCQAAEAVAAKLLRKHVTVPADPNNLHESWTDVSSGGRLPVSSCACCSWSWNGGASSI